MTTRRTESTNNDQPRPEALSPDRGLFRQPLLSAVALAPWLIFHAFVGSPEPMGIAAYVGLRDRMMQVVTTAWWAPACIVLLVLVAAHSASRAPWNIRPVTVLWIYVEAVGWSLPMLGIRWATAMLPHPLSIPSWATSAAGRAGAALYEEFAFRVVLMTILVILGTHILHAKRERMGMVAIVVSGVMFAASHGCSEGWSGWMNWHCVFVAASGLYLAAVFWYRGYGVAAGAHMAYNLMADAW